RMDLACERLISTEQELLTGLSACVERAGNLRTAEASVGEEAAILARERNTLRSALVDDVHAHLSEPIHVRLASAEVATFDGVVEEAIDAIAVVLVVLRRVDAALSGDAVGAARAVLIA